MKFLFIEPYAKLIPHFGTSLELIKELTLSIDKPIIKFLFCDATIQCCDINLNHQKLHCVQCQSVQKKGLNFFSQTIETAEIINLVPSDYNKLSQVKQDFSSISDLQNYYIDNFDIGYGVTSTIISSTRNPKIDTELHRNHINQLLIESYKVFLSVQNHIKQFKPDRVYFFNGRLGILRAIMRACEITQTSFYIHERGSNINKYMLYENTLPHDIEYNQNLINKLWQNADISDKVGVATSFFEERARGINRQWVNFTDKQNLSLLPPNWDSSKENIAIFNSSEDEFASIGKAWQMKTYENQIEAIKQITQAFVQDKKKHFYLRVHPNLNTAHPSVIKEIFTMQSTNLTIIASDSEISSYLLLKSATKIISFGSTMGVEAVYWGKPSILLGVSYYLGLGCVYEPQTHQETIQLLNSNLLPLSKEGALKYGYFINSFGNEYKYYTPNNLFAGDFMGKKIEEQFPLNIFGRLFRKFIYYWIKRKSYL